MVTRKHKWYRAYDGLGVWGGNQPLETSWVWRKDKEGNRLILVLVCTSPLTFGSWMLPGSRTMSEAIRPVDTLSPGTGSCKLVLCSHNALLLSFWRHPPNPGTFCKDKMVCLYHQEQVVSGWWIWDSLRNKSVTFHGAQNMLSLPGLMIILQFPKLLHCSFLN